MQPVAPIKIGEYLLPRLPGIGIAGSGDIDLLIKQGVFNPADRPWPDSGVEGRQLILDVAFARPPGRASEARQCGPDAFSLDAPVRNDHRTPASYSSFLAAA
ncbi:hypothetical protein [Jiella sp. M17.18]|uniref:hypothetical protein n=1 Tax=Jiella sp. M17.18 TaxID=3234247 RepID=UPI0034DE5138